MEESLVDAAISMEETSVDVRWFSESASTSSQASRNPASSNQTRSLPVLDTNSVYYDMKGKKYMIIYNHHTYKKTRYFKGQPNPRNGTYEDVKSLKQLFSKLDFEVIVYHDKEYQEIEESLRSFCNDNHSETSCVCVVILSHGGKGGELYAADRPYQLQKLIELFEIGDPGLVTKPKLFLVQACRGRLMDEGKSVQVDGDDSNVIKIPTHSDFLVLCSTVEDYVAYRDKNGSWMVQAFCEMVEKYHQELDILQIITLMNQKVAIGRVSHNPDNPEFHGKKQMPETRFTLTKFFKFK
ncbi:hypothetical protein K1T71_002323 [Dendrolimus kikuchii]|uniref:Uncharacterized protein n=1 Tax=Dendrolimus kikuchii TaxID=765133 RepID=A0ACC1DCM1_9NEOP|nr:hypothetical protein K1T71_002323 [Dendrolimus kikuchii]